MARKTVIESRPTTPEQGGERRFTEAELERRERRRYALLQAAATIVRGLTFTQVESRDVRKTVDAAEMLLAEIEKREKTEAER